ncbi:MAG: GMC family oxidoreductase N-terminal domain-containing protein, partial [Rhizobiaceae bacterium]|nr:GMC family oxidoreductase N-terminal domain-containing protein [Rhizobiaceae bacterium]
NQRSGIRWNTAKAFLRPALKQGNLTVLTKAQVRRLLIEEDAVVGVEFQHDGEAKRAYADRETVLSAGSIGSPQILELSGIGRGDVLGRAGIEVVREVRSVGENLQDHLQLRMAYKVTGVPTLNEKATKLIGKATIGLEYLVRRSGPMAMAPSQLGIFTRSGPDKETPDLQYHVQPVSLDKFGDPVHPFPAITASVCNLRPESRGSVHIQSPDFAMQPAISPNYLSSQRDRDIAVRSIRLTRRIVAQPSFAKFKPEEFKPGPSYQTEADLERAAGDIGTTIFHPVGTCRMGSDPQSVVDPSLKFRSLKRLRIADASVMPSITSGNTNSPTIMIAEKAAQMILADAR